MPTSIDLRSDTVTKPPQSMREAMLKAEVGDDVFGEDPTVNNLEELAAELTGKESSLFVSSGTMGNLVSLLSHCGRGDEAIIGNQSHIHIHEQGGVAALGSIHTRILQNANDGTLNLQEIEQAINEDDLHCARTRLIALENTWHGRTLPLSYISSVSALAARHGLALHMDGARIFNAAVTLALPVKAIAEHVDTLQFCLSKGLACPAGSIICGSKDFIAKARRYRKAVGGGMRQSGFLAACGIVALTTMVSRLNEDHTNAQRLATGLAAIDGIKVRYCETNMVFFSSALPQLSDRELVKLLAAEGLLCFDEPLGIRAVTHYGISEADIDLALDMVSKAISKHDPVRR
ncbi:MAG: low-specificity L-threonine aldolase [Candidatus Obscuribacterales bacterium]|nr:low-specificity L-threonine aldolase [Candidatus Obscuribacterales bacterium]